jgi:hypothetical protein
VIVRFPHLIRQPDHAQLAGAIMARSVALADHPRRASILHAVAEHDNGWIEEDRVPVWNPADGGVFDFISAPDELRQRVWPRGVMRLAGDPWSAALVAQHAETIYERCRPDSAWAAFFAEIDRLRGVMLGVSGLSMADLVADYVSVRLGDLISLAFCAGWTDEQRFDRWSVLRTGERVVVSPDIFGGEVVPMRVAARELPKRAFQSETELEAAWVESRTTTLIGEVAGR